VQRFLFALAIVATLATPTRVRTQTPTQSLGANSLAPILWMTGSWRAETPASAGEHPVMIEEHIASVLSGKAVAFTSTFNGVQQYQGLFAYDAAKKAIVFWYPSASGELTSGTVSQQGGYLLLDLQVADSDGNSTPFQVRIKPVGADDYDWTLYGHSSSEWKAMLSLHYHRVAS
jgi:hypothetical protein